MQHPLYILWDPQRRGTKLAVVASPRPCRGPKRGRKCYVTPAFSGILNKGEQNQHWLPPPCFLGGQKDGGNAMSPLHSWGSLTKGTKIRSPYPTPALSMAIKWRKCDITPAFSGIPN